MPADGLFASLLSPMVLAFVLGIVAARIRSNLRFPDELYIALTIYLLAAIGLKGGYKLSLTGVGEFWKPGLAAIALAGAIPLWSYAILRKLGRFGVPDAAAVAAHFGSVSVATFSAALAYLEAQGTAYEGFVPSLLAIMEVPAILVALTIARRHVVAGPSDPMTGSTGNTVRELLADRSTVLLAGFLVIGALSGPSGWPQVSPLFDAPFRGVLTLFLLEAGLVTGRRLPDLATAGGFLIGFGIVMPVVHAVIGIALGKMAGLSLGGSTVLGVLAASASYIAAPAAIRVALPQASPSYYLTASLAIAFPFNIVVGIPLYYTIARWIYGG